jgi:hypothetical protein
MRECGHGLGGRGGRERVASGADTIFNVVVVFIFIIYLFCSLHI